jgi:putative transposase
LLLRCARPALILEAMPRTSRAAIGGYCYHVLNRGNRRSEVFHGPDDYAAFVTLLCQACARVPMRLLAWCLMPNHFHLALWPEKDSDLAKWLHWLLTTHVRRYNLCYRLTGHVWQGRFKAFPVQEDEHLLTMLRYVERNPLRANLVGRAEDWPWSSLNERLTAPLLPMLAAGPVPLPGNWLDYVNAPQTEGELERIRRSVVRSCPYGSVGWVERTARDLGLESSLRPRGRPPHPAPPQARPETESLFQGE